MGFNLHEIVACLTVSVILTFQSCIICLSSPVIYICIRPFSKKLYHKQLTHILSYWSQNLIFTLQWLAPSQMVFYFDESCPPSSILKPVTAFSQQRQGKNSSPTNSSSFSTTGEFSFPERTIFISNHQIYADWMYIWFIAYLANAHGSLKIMLKNSLKYLPFFGQAMQLIDFIFMKRRLIDDKDNIIRNLERSKKGNWPMWLVLFPEGTVISEEMREKSQAFAKKNNMEDNLYTLLPRSTGLQLCANTLGDSVEWMYDLTIGYPGIEPGDIPEDTLRLKHIFTGKGPSKIHVHIRRYHISDLPLQDDKAFSKWIMDRWVEKDKRMEQFYEEGRFVSFDHGELDEACWINDESPLMDHAGIDGGHTYRVPIKLRHPFRESLSLWLYMIPYVPVFYLFYRVAYHFIIG